MGPSLSAILTLTQIEGGAERHRQEGPLLFQPAEAGVRAVWGAAPLCAYVAVYPADLDLLRGIRRGHSLAV